VNIGDLESADLSRRRLLQGALTGAAVAGSAALLSACGGGSPSSSGGTAASGSGSGWKQFKGTTLHFISENTAPTAAIAADTKPFTDLTGINIKISQMELGSLVQKVALDFGSGGASYEVIYADPYQVLAPYHQGLIDLNAMIQDKSLPQVPKGIDDFIPTQLLADGRFADQGPLYTLPYDCPTMVWIYRKDIFDKFKKQMQQDLGFDPTPSASSTWEQYYQIAKWFNDHKKQTGIPYGTGHQAKQYDSLQCDFSNVLAAYGGGYFSDDAKVGGLGTKDPGPCQLGSSEAIAAAEFYNKLLAIANPGSTSWDWTGDADAFNAEQMVMTPNWHEFASSHVQKFGDKVGFARLPRGPKRAAGIYGGTGIGINANASADKQKAAWLFLVWATSPKAQLLDLKSKVGGGTPTRTSVYEMPAVQKGTTYPTTMPNLLSTDAARETWKSENIYLRPKIPQWNHADTIIFTELSKMLAGKQSPEATMKSASSQIDKVVGA
jgi:multiple sugar transport system substrate-binding protein